MAAWHGSSGSGGATATELQCGAGAHGAGCSTNPPQLQQLIVYGSSCDGAVVAVGCAAGSLAVIVWSSTCARVAAVGAPYKPHSR